MNKESKEPVPIPSISMATSRYVHVILEITQDRRNIVSFTRH